MTSFLNAVSSSTHETLLLPEILRSIPSTVERNRSSFEEDTASNDFEQSESRVTSRVLACHRRRCTHQAHTVRAAEYLLDHIGQTRMQAEWQERRSVFRFTCAPSTLATPRPTIPKLLHLDHQHQSNNARISNRRFYKPSRIIHGLGIFVVTAAHTTAFSVFGCTAQSRAPSDGVSLRKELLGYIAADTAPRAFPVACCAPSGRLRDFAPCACVGEVVIAQRAWAGFVCGRRWTRCLLAGASTGTAERRRWSYLSRDPLT